MRNVTDQVLLELQATIDREIPLCAHMGIQVDSYRHGGVMLRAPLALNRNLQRTGFAGSLNALCTIAGWCRIYLLLYEHEQLGEIVIRRSSIRYFRPVDSQVIFAYCHPVAAEAYDYFLEMLVEKGQGKLDLEVDISLSGAQAVAFQGSYVVRGRDT